MWAMLACVGISALGGRVTMESLLDEMTDRTSLARWPKLEYRSLQATSYNRESTRRDKPGWFADSDGTGFIRQDGDEYVMMEHEGPGCITKMWTPFFYYDFNDRKGPNVRIYLDGAKKPVIDEPFIDFVRGNGSVPKPWAIDTARAGDIYLPIPFSKSAKVVMVGKPFYFTINYRAYPAGTDVETYVGPPAKPLKEAAQVLATEPPKLPLTKVVLAPGQTKALPLPSGTWYVDTLAFEIDGVLQDPGLLRSTVLSARFDDVETVWCPLGDFFCSSDAIHPMKTQMRSVDKTGRMTSSWVMPYRRSAELRLTNNGRKPVTVRWGVRTRPWKWDAQSMVFYARWRPDDVVPGTPFTDWNFVDISGQGVYVGDSWTVLNIRRDSWWGEGDEKIYIDGDWDKGFPSHFGTGTEDYYGWAGGVYPTLEDEFSIPFLSNVKVGGLDGHTLGYNICTRQRGLDAIPFKERLRFDMESSFGTDMREPWNLLGYSAVTFFYAYPGAKHNRPPVPEATRKPIHTITELEAESARIRRLTIDK